MKSCSYCGLESDEAATACAGCGQEFTAAAAPVDPVLLDSEEDLVVLAWYLTVVEADMLKLRLESAGIEACVPEELNPQLLWYGGIPNLFTQITVRVRARDLAAAREVLADPGSPTPQPPPLPPPPPPPLPPPPPARTLK